MGEANKRGSFEQRQQLAIEREAVQEATRKKAEQDKRDAWISARTIHEQEQDAKRVIHIDTPRRSRMLATTALAVAGISAMYSKGRP